MANRPERWAIIGGGMLGMALAHGLARRGRRVTLFEAAGHLGGLADAWQLGDVAWDRHYHVILASDAHLRGLLAELDLEREIDWVQTKTGFYADGNLYSVSNAMEFLRFPPLGMLDRLRLAWTIWYGSKITNWRRLEAIPVLQWLQRCSGRRTVEKLWLPLLRAKLGENYRKTSAAFIWATIARLYAARRSGLKKEVFGYVPGGYARISDRFTAKLVAEGVELRLGQAVQRVQSAPGGTAFVYTPEGRREPFDRVVLTVAAPLVLRMCPDLAPAEKQLHAAVQYQGIVCASLLCEQPLAGYYVTNITDDWVPFTGVIETTALVDRRTFGGRTLLYLPKYVSPDDPLFEQSDAAIQEQFLAALERMYPAFSRRQVQAFRVSRVRALMAVPTINYSQHLPPVRTSLPGVFVLNGARIVHGTFNVNETVRLAKEALDGLLLPATPASADPHETSSGKTETLSDKLPDPNAGGTGHHAQHGRVPDTIPAAYCFAATNSL
ncbi:MAG: NAD(P)/FAD-dependent oxidoreductase [Thermoguttaceae bacterium]|jgi:protoporphyrinogen oxidase